MSAAVPLAYSAAACTTLYNVHDPGKRDQSERMIQNLEKAFYALNALAVDAARHIEKFDPANRDLRIISSQCPSVGRSQRRKFYLGIYPIPSSLSVQC